MSVTSDAGTIVKPEDQVFIEDLPYIRQSRIPEVLPTQTSRKRKRGSSDDAGWQAFAIQVHNPAMRVGYQADRIPQKQFPDSSNNGADTYSPQFLLPRSCLPLAFLDTGSGVSGPRLFTANINILKNLEGSGTSQALVLIARSESDRCLYAVERIQGALYALCRLESWVSLQTLEKLGHMAKSVIPRTPQYCKNDAIALEVDWWRRAATLEDEESLTPRSVAGTAKPRLSLSRQPPMSDHISLLNPTVESDVTKQLDEAERSLADQTSQEPEEVSNFVKIQYQETLYVSKVS